MSAGAARFAAFPMDENARLELPTQGRELFARNFVRQVVAELRFPALLDLEAEVPKALRQEVRREYPISEAVTMVTLNPGTVAPRSEPQYTFKTRDKTWTFGVRPSALTLESVRYVRFAEFAERITTLIGTASKHMDLVFFTRVGLRYVNALPVKQGSINGWLNDALEGPLAEKRLGWLTECFQQLHGYAQAGRFSLRHGIEPNTQGKGEYIIDTDFYREDVELAQAPSLLTTLNRESFSLFIWTLGDKAISFLGEGSGGPD